MAVIHLGSRVGARWITWSGQTSRNRGPSDNTGPPARAIRPSTQPAERRVETGNGQQISTEVEPWNEWMGRFGGPERYQTARAVTVLLEHERLGG